VGVSAVDDWLNGDGGCVIDGKVDDAQTGEVFYAIGRHLNGYRCRSCIDSPRTLLCPTCDCAFMPYVGYDPKVCHMDGAALVEATADEVKQHDDRELRKMICDRCRRATREGEDMTAWYRFDICWGGICPECKP
jgi:hypothetical protein